MEKISFKCKQNWRILKNYLFLFLVALGFRGSALISLAAVSGGCPSLWCWLSWQWLLLLQSMASRCGLPVVAARGLTSCGA